LSNVVLPSGFFLRDYQKQDFDSLSQFWNICGLGGTQRGDSSESIDVTLNHNGDLILLISDKGEIAGSSWITNDGRRTYIHHFGIAPHLHGQGLSKILLATTLKRAVAKGMQIKIEVHRKNVIALNLYSKAGFKPLGDYDVYMIRDLSSLQGLI